MYRSFIVEYEVKYKPANYSVLSECPYMAIACKGLVWDEWKYLKLDGASLIFCL